MISFLFTLSILPQFNLVLYYYDEPIIILKVLNLMGELACLKELLNHVFFKANLAVRIAPSSCSHCSSHQNSPPVNLVNNKLANAFPGAPSESNNSPTLIFQAPSYIPTPEPTLDIAAPALAILLSIKKLFKQFIEICIEKVKN